MIQLAALVSSVLTVYGFGWVAHTILTWIDRPGVAPARQWLERLYLPLLTPVQTNLPPANIGAATIDFAPWVLLAVVWNLRAVLAGFVRR